MEREATRKQTDLLSDLLSDWCVVTGDGAMIKCPPAINQMLF